MHVPIIFWLYMTAHATVALKAITWRFYFHFLCCTIISRWRCSWEKCNAILRKFVIYFQLWTINEHDTTENNLAHIISPKLSQNYILIYEMVSCLYDMYYMYFGCTVHFKCHFISLIRNVIVKSWKTCLDSTCTIWDTRRWLFDHVYMVLSQINWVMHTNLYKWLPYIFLNQKALYSFMPRLI